MDAGGSRETGVALLCTYNFIFSILVITLKFKVFFKHLL